MRRVARRWTLFSWIVLLVVAARVAARADKPGDALSTDLAHYHVLIAAYRSGDRTVPQQVLSLHRDRFRSVLAALATKRDPVNPWEPERFTAAAVMHTEAAFLSHGPTDDRTFEQLDIASQILAKGGPEVHDFAGRWYVAVSRVLRDRLRLEDAERLLELGRSRLPGDPAVLCESGTLEEYLATDPRYSPALRSIPAGALPSFREWPKQEAAIMDRRARRLKRAATFLQAAVDRQSPDASCSLHLGRVLSLQADYPAAEGYLQPLRSSEDVALSYLASLFLGAAAERQSLFADAASHYRDAIARVPRAHAAYFALSSAMYRQGRADEARAALADAVLPDENNRRDPFWWYFVDPGGVATQRLETLRREAVK